MEDVLGSSQIREGGTVQVTKCTSSNFLYLDVKHHPSSRNVDIAANSEITKYVRNEKKGGAPRRLRRQLVWNRLYGRLVRLTTVKYALMVEKKTA
ncbi:hypothetical protein KIN20_025169 [Parelaphostrongylus tenuis]|uniref:60S ribosomal protein L28 n=1 Tax=Parelaphostrongylus tenuis TaxID=148309 RepID=A0AAD5MUQ8_PARTN|nr:hypothetical protein KIN20_025169 [Parelaphostrongylus tenuis]